MMMMMMMKTSLFLSLLPCALAELSTLRGDSLRLRFQKWMQEFGKEYENAEEFAKRLEIWTENHFFIEEHNVQQQGATFTLGHNQFSDLTKAEFHQLYKLGAHSPGVLHQREEVTSSQATARKLEAIPEEIDWVEKGAIVPVKNQGFCGSCWAFSAIGAIEGAHYLDTGNLVALSEQQLVDCDPLDLGCGGGLMDNAFLFDENSTGICSELDYPYAGHKRWFRGCASEKGLCEGVEHTRVKTFVDVENTAEALMEALAKQPVSVAIEADMQSFQFYHSGVYSDPQCGNDLDHGVLAVGYGTTDDGQNFFKVRNSWGPTWGDEGYIKMSRDSPQVNGTCGILGFASRPILRDDE